MMEALLGMVCGLLVAGLFSAIGYTLAEPIDNAFTYADDEGYYPVDCVTRVIVALMFPFLFLAVCFTDTWPGVWGIVKEVFVVVVKGRRIRLSDL